MVWWCLDISFRLENKCMNALLVPAVGGSATRRGLVSTGVQHHLYTKNIWMPQSSAVCCLDAGATAAKLV